jgi:hypothetical protein
MSRVTFRWCEGSWLGYQAGCRQLSEAGVTPLSSRAGARVVTVEMHRMNDESVRALRWLFVLGG